MFRINFITMVIALQFCGLINYSQPLKFEFKHYSIKDGLSEVNARCIAGDRYGFLWIGTQDGLNRYDGYEFTVFRHSRSDTNSVPDNFILSLLKDYAGRLWIGTQNGLSIFNPDEGKFTNYSCGTNAGGDKKKGIINEIYRDRNSIIWLGFADGKLVKFDKNKDRLTDFWQKKENTFKISRRGIKAIYEDSRGILWLAASGSGLYSFDKLSGKLHNYRYAAGKDAIYSNALFALTEDSKGDILIGSFRGLLVFNPRKERFQNYFIMNNNKREIKIGVDAFKGIHINSLYKDSRGNIWAGSLLEGLFFLKNGETGFVNYKNDAANPNSVSNNNIFDFYEDDGILWIGTGKGGINKLDRRKKYFMNINSLKDGISNNGVGSVLEDRRGNLWIGTDFGLSRIDAKTKKTSRFFHSENDKNSLSNNKITALAEDKFGVIWAGTRYGLNKFAPNRNKFVRFVHSNSNPESLPFNSIRYIFCDSDGIVWLGSSGGGLIKFEPRENLFTQYRTIPGDSNSISGNMITHIRQDNNGAMWICTRSAVNKFYPGEEKFERFYFKINDRPAVNFLCTYEDGDGIVWIGAEDGLIKYNSDSGEYRLFTENDEFSGRDVYSIFPDSNNNLWMSSLRGITKFNKETEKFVNYGAKDGIGCREFNVSAFYKSESGIIYFGSVNGVTYFNPDSVKPRTRVPKVTVSDFRVFDKSLRKNKIYSDGEEITLSYSQNFISLSFSALDFTEPYLNQYAYKLVGVDQGWVYSGARRYASYTNLEPGRYIFKVKIFDAEVSGDDNCSSLIINIIPVFWQTWQFKVLPPLALAAVIAFFVFLKIRSMIELERLRVKIASDLHDDVGASLSKISLNAGMIPYESDAAVKKRGDKLISLSQEVVSTMSDIVWSIDARNDKSVNLIDRMKNFALNFAEEKQIDVNIKIKCGSPDKKIGIEFRQNVYLIFKEAFNNAVKYSDSESFDLKIFFDGKKFEMIFADNGKGLPADFETKGNGIGNMKMRAKRIDAALHFANERGLTVILRAQTD